MTSPRDALELVHDEATFLAFLEALAADWEDGLAKEKVDASSPYGPNANGWENTTVGAVLDAAVRWAEASRHGLPLAGYSPSPNPWKRCADIIYMGKIYE